MRYNSILKRQSLLIVYITIILFFSGCEKTWYDEYRIVNDTNYTVTIDAYDTDIDLDLKNETFVINPNSEHRILKARGFQADYPGVFKYPTVDSVIINFDNEKIIIQSCDQFDEGHICKFDRNIMDFLNEEDFVKTGSSPSIQYTYTLTEADYERAVPIEAK